MKDYSEVLQVPNWDFVNEIIYNDIKYFHGEGCGSFLQSLLRNDKSIVFGHYHIRFELIYAVNRFAMCCGWLGDDNSIAFDYAKSFIKKPILGCGVVLNNLPILIPMN